MSTCYLLDLFVHLSSDDVGSCRVKRNHVPCLVCGQMMDLVEVTQAVNLYFLPICFNAKTMSYLDCSHCGFSSTLASYQYLQACHNDGSSVGVGSVGTATTGGWVPTSHKHIDGTPSSSCRSCRSKLLEGWQYCPTCGNKSFQAPIESSRAPKVIQFHPEKQTPEKCESPPSLAPTDSPSSSEGYNVPLDENDDAASALTTPDDDDIPANSKSFGFWR